MYALAEDHIRFAKQGLQAKDPVKALRDGEDVLYAPQTDEERDAQVESEFIAFFERNADVFGPVAEQMKGISQPPPPQ